MTRTLLDLITLGVVAVSGAGAGWFANDVAASRRYRRIAEAVRAERMGP